MWTVGDWYENVYTFLLCLICRFKKIFQTSAFSIILCKFFWNIVNDVDISFCVFNCDHYDEWSEIFLFLEKFNLCWLKCLWSYAKINFCYEKEKKKRWRLSWFKSSCLSETKKSNEWTPKWKKDFVLSLKKYTNKKKTYIFWHDCHTHTYMYIFWSKISARWV